MSSSATDSSSRLSIEQWRLATRFDSTDIGWVLMSIGMAIGAGIVFLPVQVGLVGIWVFLLSAAIGYPGMYLFQRLFINTLAKARESQSYPDMITSHLGKRWGLALGALYFMMLVLWMFVYAIAITRDSASYLRSFGVTQELLSQHAWYGLALITALVAVASRSERALFRISSLLVLTKLLIVAALGFLMISHWDISHLDAPPAAPVLAKEVVVTLPFTLTSILFIQTLSPMVISYRAREQSIEVAQHKALRAMNVAFGVLFVTVFFYAISFTLAMSHDDAMVAYRQNISALAIMAEIYPGSWASIVGAVLNVFAVMTAFFGVYLGFREAVQGLLASVLARRLKSLSNPRGALAKIAMVIAILLAWSAIEANPPVLLFTSLSSPIFGLIGCLIPALLVWRVPALRHYKGPGLAYIILMGLLLIISPFLARW